MKAGTGLDGKDSRDDPEAAGLTLTATTLN